MAISKRLRYEILRRDNHACRYCGACAPDVALTVDHVVPVALGGGDEPSNLVTACTPCNSGKSASAPDAPIVADVAADALRWARAMQVASLKLSMEHGDRDEVRDRFWRAWHQWTYPSDDGGRRALPLPHGWQVSIDNLTAAGMDHWVRSDAIEETMIRTGVQDHFRYFCGVAWNQVRRMQEMAAGELARETNGAD